MTISSRTPGGVPNRCPVCDNEICIEPSTATGDAPCPRCGCLLWFVNLPRGTRLYKHEDISPKKRQMIEALLSLRSARRWLDGGLDSLDAVELAMEFEEKFSIDFADPDLEKIKTLEDFIDFILRKVPD